MIEVNLSLIIIMITRKKERARNIRKNYKRL